MTRTFRHAFTLIALGALACGQVGQEAEEAASTLSDPDATWQDTREEAAEVIDELGDAATPNDGIELENELDRQIDELNEGVSTMWAELAARGIAEDDSLRDELKDIEKALEKAGADMEAAANEGGDAVDRIDPELQEQLDALDARLKEIGDELDGSS